MLPTVAEGGNFAIRPVLRGWIHCEIWQRPDLSRVEGARLASEIADHLKRFSGEYVGLIFDLRRATPIWGPATEEAIGRMFAPWEARGKPVFVIPADDALQQIAIRKLLAASAPRQGRIFDDLESAFAELEIVHSSGGARSHGPISQGPRSRR